MTWSNSSENLLNSLGETSEQQVTLIWNFTLFDQVLFSKIPALDGDYVSAEIDLFENFRLLHSYNRLAEIEIEKSHLDLHFYEFTPFCPVGTFERLRLCVFGRIRKC